MRKSILAFAAAGAAALTFGALHAQQGGPPALGTHDASKVTAGTYKADPNHTQILYTYGHLGLTNNMGLLSGANGTLTLDPKAPNNAKLSIDVLPVSSAGGDRKSAFPEKRAGAMVDALADRLGQLSGHA